jgi:hypothetical protein
MLTQFRKLLQTINRNSLSLWVRERKGGSEVVEGGEKKHQAGGIAAPGALRNLPLAVHFSEGISDAAPGFKGVAFVTHRSRLNNAGPAGQPGCVKAEVGMFLDC